MRTGAERPETNPGAPFVYVSGSSSQGAKKTAGLNYAGTPGRTSASQVTIAGNDQVCFAGQGSFQDPVACWVLGDHPQADGSSRHAREDA